jgi:hypothetical protein
VHQTFDQPANQNITNTPIPLHLFAYSDFDLANSPYSDTVSRPTADSFLQKGKGMHLTKAVQSPTPDHWEASYYAITLAGLLDSSPLTLSDSFIPAVPGDQTFSFQWDVTLGVGQSIVANLTNRLGPISSNALPQILMPVRLEIALSGANIVLSWPTYGMEAFELQFADSLSPQKSWDTVTNLPVVVGQ